MKPVKKEEPILELDFDRVVNCRICGAEFFALTDDATDVCADCDDLLPKKETK